MNAIIDDFCKDFCFEKGITNKQCEVIKLIMKGYLIKQIAYELGVTESTVKLHIGRIFKKLGIHNRIQIVIFGYKEIIKQITNGKVINPAQAVNDELLEGHK